MNFGFIGAVLAPMLFGGLLFVPGAEKAKAHFTAWWSAAGAAVQIIGAACLMQAQTSVSFSLCGGSCGLISGGMGNLYTLISACAFLFAAVFSDFYFKGKANVRFYRFWLITEGAVAGVFLASDLFTLFLFFEVMSLASWVWVAFEETPGALQASDTYLAVSVIGGLVMLMGLLMIKTCGGTLQMNELDGLWQNASRKGGVAVGAGCLLFGFGAKAGMFPLHIWLPKAHPAAPAPASAILSGILTKTGIFGIIITTCRIMSGNTVFAKTLLWLGVVTMLLGAVRALSSTDIKATLACSSVSQIGFILVGIGVCALSARESEALETAAAGVLLHMTNHSLFKLLLFCIAGTVYEHVHSLSYAKIRGFGAKRPLLKALYIVGAAGIAGVPLLSGYVSKTMLHEGIVLLNESMSGGGLKAVEILFLLAGGFTCGYMLRLYAVVFTGKGNTAGAASRERTLPVPAAIVLTAAACCVVALGVMPEKLGLQLLAAKGGILPGLGLPEIELFSWECLKGAGISLGIGLLLFLVPVQLWLNKKGTDGKRSFRSFWPAWLDLERLYRFLLLKALPGVLTAVTGFLASLPDKTKAVVLPCVAFVRGLADMPDGMVRVLQLTLFRPRRKHTHEAGAAAVYVKGVAEHMRLIMKTLSLGLLLACVGIALILGYILIHLFWGI